MAPGTDLADARERNREGVQVDSSKRVKRPDPVLDFAEDLGRLLGTAQAKAEGWLNQRKAIAQQLTQIRDTANQYLQQLSAEGASLVGRVKAGRRGRPVGSKNVATAEQPAAARKGVRKMTAAQRKAVGDRMRKYWAGRRKEGAK